MAFISIVLGFLISLIISAIIIYLAAKLLGEQEGFGTAILAALIGSIIFAVASFFIATGWIVALVGGLAWLLALGSIYQMGWLKSLGVAILIWIFATIISMVLPTIAPL